jgi:hypothetical protein
LKTKKSHQFYNNLKKYGTQGTYLLGRRETIPDFM